MISSMCMEPLNVVILNSNFSQIFSGNVTINPVYLSFASITTVLLYIKHVILKKGKGGNS